jgi:hypothetical protein
MRVLLHRIVREHELHRVRLTVQIGDSPLRDYLADYDDSDPTYKRCNVEQELFMQLSDLATRRYCNCVIYQMELMGIIGAFISNQSIPDLPIELGTTMFGIKRPSQTKIFIDRLRRPFILWWYWWKFRKERKENLTKYRNAA